MHFTINLHLCNKILITQSLLCLHILDPPVIDEGSFVPRPSVFTNGTKRVKIGTPVYVYKGFDVIIDCNTVDGTPPITITWFRNGSSYPTRGNTPNTITITNARDRDSFKCRADNNAGFDSERTIIYVKCGKYIIHNTYIRTHKPVYTYVLLHTYVLYVLCT